MAGLYGFRLMQKWLKIALERGFDYGIGFPNVNSATAGDIAEARMADDVQHDAADPPVRAADAAFHGPSGRCRLRLRPPGSRRWPAGPSVSRIVRARQAAGRQCP